MAMGDKTSSVTIEGVEEIALKVDGMLGKLSEDNLYKLTDEINYDLSIYPRLTKFKLLKYIRSFIDKSTEGMEEESQYELYSAIINSIHEIVDRNPSTTVTSPVTATVAGDAEQPTPPTRGPAHASNFPEEGATASFADQGNRSRREAPIPSRSIYSGFSLDHLKREAKIQGKIGETSDKDTITFGGLILQISNFKDQNYTDREIQMAILKAMTPTLNLRRLIESMGNAITLSKLLMLLRTHYKEKRPSELYQELLNVKQESTEDAISFLWRAFELRARIDSASSIETDPSQRYDPRLVESVMLSSIDSGLRDPLVRSQLSPILHTPYIGIEEISSKLQTILYTESIRQSKHGVSTPTVAPVTSGTNPKKPSEEDKVLNTLKSLQGQIASLTNVKTEIADLKTQFQSLGKGNNRQGGNSITKKNYKAPVCPNCEANGHARCNHCRNCLGENHQARHCTKPKN